MDFFMTQVLKSNGSFREGFTHHPGTRIALAMAQQLAPTCANFLNLA
jgi:hypothetical protein